MFGNKNKNKEPEVQVEVESIPAEFYGGVNPVVKFKQTEKEIELKSTNITVPEKRAFDKASVVGSGSKLHLANLLTSPKFLFLSAGSLFVVFAAVAGIYYWQQSRSNSQIVTPPVSVVVTPVFEAEQPVIEEIATTTEIVEVTTTPVVEIKQSIFDVPPVYPSMTLGKSNDTDKDDLTDMAEELFLTDLGAPDSDKDKYSDSHEIYNLYNPVGKEPKKLVDSGLVTDFVNPVFGYKVYYPKNWAAGSVDENYRDVLFSTLTGESIEIRAIEKTSPDGSFADWFVEWAPNEKIADLKEFFTVFKDKGWERSDNLVYYFETPKRVYVILYHTTGNSVVNFDIVIKMMARSFRLPLTDEVLPPPIVEDNGIETAVTSTAVVSSTSSIEVVVPTSSATSSL